MASASDSLLSNDYDDDEIRKCFICWEGESHDQLIQPCRCKPDGLKYVHPQCIELWLESQSRLQSTFPAQRPHTTSSCCLSYLQRLTHPYTFTRSTVVSTQPSSYDETIPRCAVCCSPYSLAYRRISIREFIMENKFLVGILILEIIVPILIYLGICMMGNGLNKLEASSSAESLAPQLYDHVTYDHYRQFENVDQVMDVAADTSPTRTIPWFPSYTILLFHGFALFGLYCAFGVFLLSGVTCYRRKVVPYSNNSST
ncbi:hypothetical protein SeLEV6574_g04566 [Synchytrium endobioticum]|uniref:RING-CH-type domain-containing protein n=1 Tax=Synchytrium endobioticum TaxID=286115 RepID=A0A507CYS4_9FUNG|nr:hypothetical protein SeLEV6574_g04566 [Synchytrium endobioticum]